MTTASSDFERHDTAGGLPLEPPGGTAHSAGADADAEADVSPTPIAWYNLWRWALETYKDDRIRYGRLHRPRRWTSASLSASIFPDLDRPVFIIGAARSGTTFLGKCIGALPELSYHHEPIATKAAGRYVYENLWGFRRSRWFYRSVATWLLRVHRDGGLRFCDKTPTNALLIPFLDEAFKGAQYIHIIRDGRDAAASHMNRPWLRADAKGSKEREPGGYLHGPHAPWWVEPWRRDEFETTSDAHRMIWAWRRYVEAAQRDGAPLGPDRYLEVRYEQLVADSRGEGDRILEFLGIRRARSRELLLTALTGAEGRSVGAWRRAFSLTQLAEIEADSGRLLRALGYADA